MAIENTYFFIGYFAGIAQVLALLIGYYSIRRMVRDHRDKVAWEHVRSQNGY